jgi:Rap1a immunity proteins
MKTIFVVAGVIVVVLVGEPAWAGRPQAFNFDTFQTGNTLLALCTSADAGEKGVCLGYVEGVTDAVTNATNNAYFRRTGTTIKPIEPHWLPGSFVPPTACISAGVTGNQVRDIAVQYLQANPASRNDAAFPLVGAALEQAFPCR